MQFLVLLIVSMAVFELRVILFNPRWYYHSGSHFAIFHGLENTLGNWRDVLLISHEILLAFKLLEHDIWSPVCALLIDFQIEVELVVERWSIEALTADMDGL